MSHARRIIALAAAGSLATGSLRAQTPATTAKVDTAQLTLTNPDRYFIPAVLEPIRRVSIVAMADGVVRSQDVKAGGSVRDGQAIAQLDRAEAAAGLKIAQAVVKELQAILDETKGASSESKTRVIAAEARLEGAQARLELAKMGLDRCTLRAPFPGRVMATPTTDGQFVDKGAMIAELADVSSLRVLVPVAKAGATIGGNLSLTIEGQPVSGKIQALLPLPESLAILHELATPLNAAWVLIPNAAATLEPGQRVLGPAIPTWPITTIPLHALLKKDEKDAVTRVQVIRNEYVTDIKVKVLGSPGPDRTQVSGPFRPTDTLILSTSVPLLAGTLIRFQGSVVKSVESTTPDPAMSGADADLNPVPGPTNARSAAAKASPTPKMSTPNPSAPAPKAATKGDTNAVPF